jgi:hypothetical protein
MPSVIFSKFARSRTTRTFQRSECPSDLDTSAGVPFAVLFPVGFQSHTKRKVRDMKRVAILVILCVELTVLSNVAHAKCLLVSVEVRGSVVGQIQEGDEMLFRFIYSNKRVETSLPQAVDVGTFTFAAAYSTFKRRGVFQADICGAKPRQIQLVMRDKAGKVLDSVDLTTPDGPRGSALNFGTTQIVVLHRTITSHL